MPIFEFNVELTRIVDEEVSVIIDGEDEEDARQKVMEFIEDPHNSEICARRYHTFRRRYHPIDELKINLVEYDEPQGPRYA